MSIDIVRHASAADLAEAVAGRLATTLVSTIDTAGIAHLCLTGGGIGTACLAALRISASDTAVDWQRVQIWWGDERFLPPGDPERNETGARAALLDHIDIPQANVHPIPGPDQAADVDVAAERYAEELASFASANSKVPSMNVLLLGVGPDAHVASLFPELPAVRETRPVVGVHGAPKPPPLRVTLTFPTIRSAREVWLLAAGAEKAEAVRLLLDPAAGEYQVPAAGARGVVRTLVCLDDAAAAQLPQSLGRPSA